MKTIKQLLAIAAVVGIFLYMREDLNFVKQPKNESATLTENQNFSNPKKDPRGIWPYIKEGSSAASSNTDLLRRNYYVVFDGSGSMSDKGCSGGQSKGDVAKKALMEFSSTVPASSNLGLLVFDGNGINERVSLGTNNREQFNLAVQNVQPSSGTPLASAIRLAYEKLTNQAQIQLGYGEYHLIVVTDGEAYADENPEILVNELLAYSPVVMHTIGFCINERHSLNQRGRVVYKAANDYSALRKGLSDVLAESEGFAVSSYANQ